MKSLKIFCASFQHLFHNFHSEDFFLQLRHSLCISCIHLLTRQGIFIYKKGIYLCFDSSCYFVFPCKKYILDMARLQSLASFSCLCSEVILTELDFGSS